MNVILPLLGGMLLGIVFFGGLWWTIRQGISSDAPALWFFASVLIRTGICVSGFYLIAQGDWRRLLICVAGFFAARIAVTMLTRVRVGTRELLVEGSKT